MFLKKLFLIFLLISSSASGKVFTIAWDAPPTGWTSTTTVELNINGLIFSGIQENFKEVDVPLAFGEKAVVKARAVDGELTSEWVEITKTLPAMASNIRGELSENQNLVYSFFNTTPQTIETTDTDSVELGLKFYSKTNGIIRGLRYYKGVVNTNQYIGNVWNQTGQNLKSVQFPVDNTIGWKEVIFDSPLVIQANTNYTISYFTPVGRYAVEIDYFTTPYEVNNLVATGSVFRYGSTSGFPTSTFRQSNYFVDIIYED